ncbi:MAG: homoserine O-succinyltransferase MetX [Gammaproteobacteria bacterium]|jgi:homoserine O-acetyltransferase
MKHDKNKDSIGIVTPETCVIHEPLSLDSGETLESYEICYETYGTLNSARTNAVLICHALSGDHHAAGYNQIDDRKPGWWDNCIGPNKPLDTNKFFVVCPNNLGGCGGSTGPLSKNPSSGKCYGPDFPIVTVRDWVESQAKLADELRIESWAAVMGGSLGGMQAIQWSVAYPNRVRNAIVIAAASKLSTQNIAFNEISRQAILADPHFNNGHYNEKNTAPTDGLKLARMIGHMTYLSDDGLRAKFGRERTDKNASFSFGAEFEVESYLQYQGDAFVNRFDANTYLLMTRALDYFDPAQNHDDDLRKTMASASARFLVVSFSSDWRFSPARSREIVRSLLYSNKDVSYCEIESEFGHDSFLLPIPDYHQILAKYFRGICI